MMVPITGLYAALLAVIVTTLSFQVGFARLRSGVSILHGEDMQLAERIRRHANFCEAVPIALVLMAIIELDGASAGLVHGLGSVLVVSRIVHPFGLRHDDMKRMQRFIGANGTLGVTLVAAGVAAWQFFNG